MVQPEEGKGPRVFYFTDAGKAHVTEQRTELEAARDAVTSSVDPNALALHDRVHQLAVAVNQVGQVGTRPQLATTQETLIAARRQLYRILADDVPAVDHSDKSITKGGEAYE